METKQFLVVNSFAEEPFGGNPAAVFPDGAGLPDETMQAIARQLNLVETVFALPAESQGGDFRLRYFTPEEELPVAGHPTVAACIALVRMGRIAPDKSYVIQTGKGPVGVHVSGSGGGVSITMGQPDPVFGGIADSGNVAETLGIAPEDLLPGLPAAAIDTGLGHLVVPVKSLDALMRIHRNIAPLRSLCDRCGVREVQAFAFEAYGAGNDLHTRNICPREGLEDPACGVGNGALGAYLLRYHYLDRQQIRIRAEQGQIVGMPAVIGIAAARHGERTGVEISGSGVLMIEGQFYVEGL